MVLRHPAGRLARPATSPPVFDAFKTSGSFTSGASASYRPGAVATGVMYSEDLEITNQNRGFSYTFALTADGVAPAPGTLIISYLELGKWYDVTDPGNGQLEGAGTGTVDYATGTDIMETVSAKLTVISPIKTFDFYRTTTDPKWRDS